MQNWHIVDWMGNVKFNDKRFNSFEEARDFITEYATQHASELAKENSMPDYPVTEEEAIQGYEEDMYAEEVENA